MKYEDVLNVASVCGVRVDTSPDKKCVEFVLGIQHSHMVRMTGRNWNGHVWDENGVHKMFYGTKAKVADWCLEQVGNVPV